ncbi:MAG TPA: four-carbon acid sugar kinase family protein [Bacillales bacterium]|nr:four-carbon acid sugar kinase family protein [Bacillales bacterium]
MTPNIINHDKIGMIADDLTGAGDSGIQFAVKGLETILIFNGGAINDAMVADVTVMNTESRGMTGEEAYQNVYEAAALMKDSGIQHLYKKMDSTLRGNWEWEIKAVADVFQPDFVIIAPAFPKMGRVTVNGRQFLNGNPIEETEMRNDPKTPVLESDMAKMLASQTGRPVQTITVRELRKQGRPFQDKLKTFKQNGINWLVFDAVRDEDLRTIANQMSKTNERLIWAGSAGLAEYLPEALQLNSHQKLQDKAALKSSVLIVAGSMSETTKKQIQALSVDPDIQTIEIDPQTIFLDEQFVKVKQKVVNNACKLISSGKDIVLYSGCSDRQKQQVFQIGAAKGFTKNEISNRISGQLGFLAKEIAERQSIRNFVVTGGDTARSVFHFMGYTAMKLVREIEPGMPHGQIIGTNSANVVTKAGAFGSELSLIHAVKYLRRGFDNE